MWSSRDENFLIYLNLGTGGSPDRPGDLTIEDIADSLEADLPRPRLPSLLRLRAGS